MRSWLALLYCSIADMKCRYQVIFVKKLIFHSVSSSSNSTIHLFPPFFLCKTDYTTFNVTAGAQWDNVLHYQGNIITVSLIRQYNAII